MVSLVCVLFFMGIAIIGSVKGSLMAAVGGLSICVHSYPDAGYLLNGLEIV